MEQEPPPPLTARNYQAGEMACLATTPSWDAPIVIFKKNMAVTSSAFEEDEVDFVWPAWNEQIDYTSMADPIRQKSPRVWLVWYEGTLWYPTLWYSQSHIGTPPTEAKSTPGQPAGYRDIQEWDISELTPGEKYERPNLINRGGEARVWLRCPPGTEEVYSSEFWRLQGGFYFRQVARYPIESINDYCDRPMRVIPFHLIPRFDYNSAGFTQDDYIPGHRLGNRKVVTVESSDSAGKVVNSFTEPDEVIKVGQMTPFIPTVYEPIGWDPLTGTMQSKIRGAEFSAYYPERSFYFYRSRFGDNFYKYSDGAYANIQNYDNGGSYTLWQKLARTTHTIQTAGYSIGNTSIQIIRSRASGSITEASPPTGAMILAHPTPVPGYAGFDLNVPAASIARCDYFPGDAFMVLPKVKASPPYEGEESKTTSSGSSSSDGTNSSSTSTQTTTAPIVVVSHPVHPAFARRQTTINLQGSTTKMTSYGSQTGGSSTVSLSYSLTTRSWTNTDANKLLVFYPFGWQAYIYIGTPTEQPPLPNQLDGGKVVASWTDYSYVYSAGWGTQYASFSTSTSTFTPGAWGDPSFSHD